MNIYILFLSEKHSWSLGNEAVVHYRQSSNNGSFLLKFNNNNNNKPCEPAHWIKVITAKLNGMSLIPRTHKMEGELTPASYILTFMYMLGHAHMHI